MSDELARVGAAVRARAVALQLNLGDIPKRGGPSASTVSRLINGKGHMPDTATLGKLEKALDWAPGSIAAVLVGHDPTALEDKGVARGSDAELLEELRTRLNQFHSSDRLDDCIGAIVRDVQGRPRGNTARRIVQFLAPDLLFEQLTATTEGKKMLTAWQGAVGDTFALAAREEDGPMTSQVQRDRQDQDAEG